MILAGLAFLRLIPALGWNKPIGSFSVVAICLSWVSHLGCKSHCSWHFFLFFLDKTVPDSPRDFFTEDYGPEDHCLDVQGAEESTSRLKACLLSGLSTSWLKETRPGAGYPACLFCIHKRSAFPSVTFSWSEVLAVSGINSIVVVDSDLRKHTFCTPDENDCLWLIRNKEAWQGSALRFKYSCRAPRPWDVEQHQQRLCKGRVDADRSAEQHRSR